jgi:hypothetical protein
MVLLDICVVGGLSYSIFGNLYHSLKTIKSIEEDIQELRGETNILRVCDYKTTIDPPTFVNMGSPGIMIPVGGGGVNEELRKIYCLLQNNEEKIEIHDDEATSTIVYHTSYINTHKELDRMYKKYDIRPTCFPVRFPLKVYEKILTIPLYHNTYCYDLKKTNVLRKTMLKNRIPFTFGVLGVSVAILGYSWMNYTYSYYRDKHPIFHPKRYQNMIEKKEIV